MGAVATCACFHNDARNASSSAFAFALTRPDGRFLQTHITKRLDQDISSHRLDLRYSNAWRSSFGILNGGDAVWRRG